MVDYFHSKSFTSNDFIAKFCSKDSESIYWCNGEVVTLPEIELLTKMAQDGKHLEYRSLKLSMLHEMKVAHYDSPKQLIEAFCDYLELYVIDVYLEDKIRRAAKAAFQAMSPLEEDLQGMDNLDAFRVKR
jgi:hypothetical protein